MLQFTRTQTTALLVAVFFICGLSVPNFLSSETVASWPKWAQGRIMLAPELQGGQSLLLEVDKNSVREYLLHNLFQDVRNILRDARIGFASPVAVRGGSVEVRPLADSFGAALDKLRELSKTFNGVRGVEVTDAGGGLIRVVPTEAGIQEYEQSITNRGIRDIHARLFGVPANVEREGPWRVRVQIPGPGVLNRLVQ